MIDANDNVIGILCDWQSHQSWLRLGLFCILGTAITMRMQ